MGITLEELNPGNTKYLYAVDGEFIIESRLSLSVEDDEIRYRVVKIPKTRKRYPAEEIDVEAYLGNHDKTVFFARVEGQIAGQIILRKNWNNYAYIVDIAVDLKFRRQGVGGKLILQAVQWARARRLAGLMLETQDNNVAACKLYEKCGFRLGGFDKYLYKGLDRATDEIALYWYLLFEGASADSDR